jgi:Ca2+-binding RTX toxin-like protein
MITLLATLLLAAPASAARFQHTGPDVDFTVAATDVVKLTVTGHKLGDPRQLTFTRGTGATPFTIGAGCSIFINTGIASCFVGDTTRLRLTTNDKPDTIDASGTATPFDASVPEVFDTKGGDDALIAGPLADTVDAGDGDDAITGGTGADQLRGGAGDDRFTGLTPGDLVDGGAGADLLDLSGDVGGGVSISLNGVADDGPLGSDGNVLGIETVRATPSADVLTGGTAAERLEGGAGADTIDTRGGGADAVDCGAGDDFARADEADQLTGCERIELPPPGGGGAGGTSPGGGGVAPGGVAPGGGEDGSGGVGAGQFVDRDGDGVLAGPDCDDSRPNVHPGARDIPGNRIDEDCDGSDGKRSLAGGRLSFDFLTFRDGSTKVATLLVRDLATGGRAELRCKGPGCRGLAKRAGKRGKGGAVNLRRLIKRRLRAGAVLEVRITAPDATGRVIRFKMRKGQRPKRTTLCLAPGEKQPGRCA